MGNVRDDSLFVGPRLVGVGLRFARDRGSRSAFGVVAALVLALAVLPGCKHPMGNMSGYLRNKQLDEAVLEYNKYLRWQEWDQASAYVKTTEQAAFKEKMEDAEESFRITEFEIKDTIPDAGTKSASVRVIYRYYWLPSISERKFSVRQRWTWSEDDRRWEVENPFTFPKRASAKPRPAASARADAPAGE